MASFPAVSAEALLAGLQACGIDAADIRRAAGLAPRYQDPIELLPNALWDAIWRRAHELDPRPELPTLAALHVPFGLFGSLDYLAGTAETVRGGLQALSDHFSAATTGTDLELDFQRADAGTLRVINSVESPSEILSDEFTTAVILGRFRDVSAARFLPQRVYLTRPSIAHSPHAALFGAPVTYDATRAGFDCSAGMLDIEQSSADPRLHATLLEVAKKLGFGNHGRGGFELAVRARLRSLLPRGQAVAERVARSLGVSERTLHRRLAESGHSFQDVLDTFRLEESERLLSQGTRELADIALSLGFSDQTAWSRAFRRLSGTTPTAWQSANRSKS
jgi:AraC-like DNA-binding protein